MSLEQSDAIPPNVDDDHKVPAAGPMSLLDQETLARIDPAILHREVEVACGSHKEDKNFRTVKASFGQLLDGLLGTFRVGDKDGLCILSGGLVTPSGCQRIAKNVTRNHLMMFDHDTGVPVEEICAKIEALGYFAVVYTTYSHLKPTTEVAESQVTKWLTKVGQKAGQDGNITPEQAADFIRENKKIVPDILAAISRVERVMVAGKGVVYRITHAPMPRCRSVLVLKDPFDFAQRGTQAQAIAEWKEKYTRVATLIDGTFDSSCTDPSRLMYTPVKAPDAAPGTHEWYVVPGGMVDLTRLPVTQSDDPYERFRAQGGDGDAVRLDLKTPNLAPFLRGYADDFEAQEWLLSVAPEDLRDNKGDRIAFCCPNEDNHTEINPQDQAFVTWNASSRPDGHGFHMLCMHDTCKSASHEKRAWYLDLLCQKYGVEDAMELRAFCPRWEEEQEAERKRRADLDTLIEALTDKPSADDINAVVQMIAALPQDDARVHLAIAAVGEKTRLGKKRVDDLVRAARKTQEESRAGENDTAKHERQAGAIYANDDLSKQVDMTVRALQARAERDPTMFLGPDDTPVRFEKNKSGKISLREMTHNMWRREIRQAVQCRHVTRAGDVEVGPFPDLVSDIIGTPAARLGLPQLDQVVTVPVFGPNGTLHVAKGYDKDLCAYLDPSLDFIPPPNMPTEDDLEKAFWWLGEMVRDFPFTDNFGGDAEDLPIRSGELDDEGFPLPNWKRGRSSRLHYYAFVLQPFVRPMIEGPCPAYHFDKPEAPGTGVSKLANTASLIFDGREISGRQLPQDDAEIGKVLTAFFRSGGNLLFFDNIRHRVASDALPLALTTGRWSARILGLSAEIDRPIRCTWSWAGNNVSFSHEVMRRNVPIRQDAATPNPAHDRPLSWFKHQDLDGWIKAYRRELVWACHTLIQNWVKCGRPAGSANLASFENWAAVMSGILECAGAPEGAFLGSLDAYRSGGENEAGTYDALVAHFAALDAMTRGAGLTATEILAALDPNNPLADSPFVGLGIASLHPERKPQELGKLLSKLCEKTFRLPDGKLVKVRRTNKTSPSKYGLAQVGSGEPEVPM